MTFATSPAFTPAPPSVWDRVGSLRAALAARVARRRLHRAALAELDALSDRDLSDIGVARGDIGRVAREPASLA